MSDRLEDKEQASAAPACGRCRHWLAYGCPCATPHCKHGLAQGAAQCVRAYRLKREEPRP